MEKRYAYYSYGIRRLEVDSKNQDVIKLYYGEKLKPLRISRKYIKQLVEAIISPKEKEERHLGYLLDKNYNDVECLNPFLQGRALILVTAFWDYNEYSNDRPKKIKKIAGLGMDGKVNMANAFDYEGLAPMRKKY